MYQGCPVTKTSHLPIRYFLALLWAHPILYISRIRVNWLVFMMKKDCVLLEVELRFYRRFSWKSVLGVLRVNAAALHQIQIFTHTVSTKLFLVRSETLLVWKDKYEVLMTAALAAVHFAFRQRLRAQFLSIGIWWFYIYISFRINFLRGHGFPKLFRLVFENGF